MVVKGEKSYFKAKYKGKITLNATETAIESITPEGYLEVREDDKKFLATSNDKGNIVYRLDDHDRSLSQSSEEGREFTSGILRDLIENGFDAEERMYRVHRRGGAKAVLDEINHMKIEPIKGMYFRYILKNDSFAPADKKEIAILIDRSMGCSPERASLLGDYASFFLQEPESVTSYLDAVNKICTNTEKTGTLNAILDQRLSDEQLGQVLSLIGTIETDIERASLIDKVLDRDSLSGSTFDQSLDLIAGINAEPDKSGLLIRMARQNIKTDAQWIRLIDKTDQLSPDVYRKEVLQEIARRMPASLPVTGRYQSSLKELTSNEP